jgi:hypothetical protein
MGWLRLKLKVKVFLGGIGSPKPRMLLNIPRPGIFRHEDLGRRVGENLETLLQFISCQWSPEKAVGAG